MFTAHDERITVALYLEGENVNHLRRRIRGLHCEKFVAKDTLGNGWTSVMACEERKKKRYPSIRPYF